MQIGTSYCTSTWSWLIRCQTEGYSSFTWCSLCHICLFHDIELYLVIIVLRFIVKEMLGQGTFGQVVKCWDTETNDYVAVKVIKNQPAFYHQAIMEVSLLRTV